MKLTQSKNASAKANAFTQTDQFTKGTGRRIRDMGMESLPVKTAINTRGFGMKT